MDPTITLYECVVSVYCVWFASLDVISDELYDCVWNVGCSNFLISVCIFIVSKTLLISSVAVIVRAWGAIC